MRDPKIARHRASRIRRRANQKGYRHAANNANIPDVELPDSVDFRAHTTKDLQKRSRKHHILYKGAERGRERYRSRKVQKRSRIAEYAIHAGNRTTVKKSGDLVWRYFRRAGSDNFVKGPHTILISKTLKLMAYGIEAYGL